MKDIEERKVTPDDIGCLEAIEALYAYIDGELTDEDSIAVVEKHLGHCRSCYSRTQMEKALSEHMKKSSRSRAPEKLQKRLRDLMEITLSDTSRPTK